MVRFVNKTLISRTVQAAVFAAVFGAGAVLGTMTRATYADAPLVVSYAPDAPQCGSDLPAADMTQSARKDCAFVGSKNSTKYYPPTCRFAARIAPENLRCFRSVREAQQAGYVRARGC